MDKRPEIFVEAICDNCGNIIIFKYQNAKTISKMKRYTKDWVYRKDIGTLCSDCKNKSIKY